MKSPFVYLDYNATTLFPEFLKTTLTENVWGNPSSIHSFGRASKKVLRQTRSALAQLLNASEAEIIFTSGGSESNNHVLKSLFFQNHKLSTQRNRILVSAVEHPSVLEAVQDLEAIGLQWDMIPVNKKGELDMKAFSSLLSDDVLLVSVMSANNETGIIFPTEELVEKAHSVGALFHCDATQSLGKVLVDLRKWKVDFASFSAHKFYGLKGCGFLYTRRGLSLQAFIVGGGQERGRRAGTENVLGLNALGQVAELSLQNMKEALTRYKSLERIAFDSSEFLETLKKEGIDIEQLTVFSFFHLKIKFLRDWMEEKIKKQIGDIQIVGENLTRLPNTSNILFSGVDAHSLVMNLDLKGFAVSSGSACSSGKVECSPVLKAMQLTDQEAKGALRISLGWWTSWDEIKQFVTALSESVEHLRQVSL